MIFVIFQDSRKTKQCVERRTQAKKQKTGNRPNCCWSLIYLTDKASPQYGPPSQGGRGGGVYFGVRYGRPHFFEGQQKVRQTAIN